MANKKGFGFSTIGKIVLFVVILFIISTIFVTTISKLKATTIEIFEREMNEFHMIGGSYYNPDALGTDFEYFWDKGFKNFLEAGMATDTQCIGAFYINDDYNMRGSELSFVNRSDALVLFLRGSKGAVAVINDNLFKKEEEDIDWRLCIIKPEAKVMSEFTQKFKKAFNENKNFVIEDSWMQEAHTITIDFKGNTKGEDIVGEYFTSEKLKIQDQAPERFDYHGYRTVGIYESRRTGGFIFRADRFDRYLFLFAITKDPATGKSSFCLVPTTREKNNPQFFQIKELEDMIKEKAKNNPDYIDSLSLFCKVPEQGKSIFNGWNSCYYYGCNDVKVNQCKDVFGKCKGLCSPKLTIMSDQCVTCKEIDKCKKYTDRENIGCLNNMCDLPCRYDSVKGKCVET